MKQILTALNQVMAKCGYVQKSGKNAFHGYKYAGEADLLEKLRPAMVEAGLILIPSVTEQSAVDEFGNTRVRIEYTLAHVSGEVWPTPIVAQGCGNDRNKNGVGDKGCYKAITGANKYLLFKLFQIETGDDPETETGDHEPAPKAAPRPTASPAAPKAPDTSVTDWRLVADDMVSDALKLRTVGRVNEFLRDRADQFKLMPKNLQDDVKSKITAHRTALELPMAAGG